jgi:hypothetical protein
VDLFPYKNFACIPFLHSCHMRSPLHSLPNFSITTLGAPCRPWSCSPCNILCHLLRSKYLSGHFVSRGTELAQSVVSGYGLDDRVIEVRSPAEARLFHLTSASRPALGPTQPPV